MSKVVDEFIQILSDSGLLSADEVRAALARIPDAEEPVDEDSLLQNLVDQGKLTSYQAAAVRDGRIDEVVLGNYVLLDKLGDGGMGTVYKAQHRRMKRVVAIKVLRQDVTRSARHVQRFQREVEAVARLNHQNIVTAYDADEASVGHFLVMEYVEGTDLARVVKSDGPLSVREAVEYVLQAARALEYAHSEGIVHRDIKPANLLLDSKGTVKVADLGLARFSDALAPGSEEEGSLTQTGSIAGTVDFMSPEQALNAKQADHRADIYSLGCTLYYLLSGKLTYGGETIMEKLLAHREHRIPKLGEARVDLPQQLDDIFKRMVAKKPEDRYQSMSELIRALESCDIQEHGPLAEPPRRLTPEEIPPTALGQDSTEISMIEMSVLLVEPSRAQSLVITSHLRNLGIQRIEWKGEGKKALESMHGSPPSLVISAMHLPDMTGTQLVERMRADDQLKHVPFILISSETDPRHLDPLRGHGTIAILPKPFDLAQLKGGVLATTNAPPETAMFQKRDLGDVKVLIVDDSVVARGRVRKVLTDLGVQDMAEATNGKEALELLENSGFDMVVTDYNMPEMDGRELLGAIRQHSSLQSIPVLMVTTESDQGKLAAVQQLGVSALCNKRFEPQVILDVLANVLAKE